MRGDFNFNLLEEKAIEKLKKFTKNVKYRRPTSRKTVQAKKATKRQRNDVPYFGTRARYAYESTSL
jgi:hypothetical protein